MGQKIIKPRIVLSQCFSKAVRYDGGRIWDDFIEKLKKYVEVIEVCPEVGMGLGIPRERLVVMQRGENKILFQPDTGRDYTEDIKRFSQAFVKKLPEVDGFILKAKSPSCGVGSTKLYIEGVVAKKTYGLFSAFIKETYPFLPLEDEGRLRDSELRDHFLTRIFALAEVRNLSEDQKALIEFHTRYKYLLLTYNQKVVRELGRIVARSDLPLKEKIELYKREFYKAFLKKPSLKKHINTLLHLVGPFSEKINTKERRHLHKLIRQFGEGLISLKVLREILKIFAYRFENVYLLSQKYLEPYPEELEINKM